MEAEVNAGIDDEATTKLVILGINISQGDNKVDVDVPIVMNDS